MTLVCAQSWKKAEGMENWTVDLTDVEGQYAPGCSSRAAEGFYSGALLGAKPPMRVHVSLVLEVRYMKLITVPIVSFPF